MSYADGYRNVLAHRSGHKSVTDKLAKLLHCMYFLLRDALQKMSLLLDRNEKVDHRRWQKAGPLKLANECGEVCATGLCASVDIKEIYDRLPKFPAKLKRSSAGGSNIAKKRPKIVNT